MVRTLVGLSLLEFCAEHLHFYRFNRKVTPRNECTEVEVPKIRIGKRQTIETLINEEALLLAKFLRDERKTWTPRLPCVQLN